MVGALALLLASVTGPLVTLATNAISSLGLGGVAVMMVMTNIVALPGTEPTMLFAGFDVFKGHLTLVGIIVAGVAGDLLGASIAYAIGHRGSSELLQRHGGKVHLSSARMERAQGWAHRYGAPAVSISRLIPGARFVFPYAAGVVRMAYLRFLVFAALGSVVWVTGLALLGREVGSSWQSWRKHLEYVDYAALALIVAAIAFLVLRRMRSGRRTPVDALSD